MKKQTLVLLCCCSSLFALSNVGSSGHSGKSVTAKVVHKKVVSKVFCGASVTTTGAASYYCEKTKTTTSVAGVGTCTKSYGDGSSEAECFEAYRLAYACSLAAKNADLAAKIDAASAACNQTTIDWIDDTP